MHSYSPRFRWIGVVLFVILAVVMTALAFPTFADTQQQAVTESEAESLFTRIYEEVSPSVVAISVTGTSASGAAFAGAGSGFVIDKEGHIVTNNHVVANATSIEVDFRDGILARGQIVGTDPDSDLAVIKVDLPADALHPVEFGDSDALQIGQAVLAIGSPFGQRWTLTQGIVSALDRTIQGLTDFSIGGVIQTDASINPGNSGGPLLDLQGRVIGVNSQIATQSGSNSGVGFAVPSNLTQKVARDLIAQGYVDYSYIGITGGDVTLDIIEELGLPNDTRGVVVTSVVPGGPAARAGLRGALDGSTNAPQSDGEIDIITAIDGQPLNGIGDLISYLARNTAPGDTVTLTVLRSGQETVQLDVLLTSRR